MLVLAAAVISWPQFAVSALVVIAAGGGVGVAAPAAAVLLLVVVGSLEQLLPVLVLLAVVD